HRVRVRAGDLSVELEWPREPGGGPAGERADRPAHAPGVPQSAVDADGEGTDVRYLGAPAVGTFYRAPEPGAPPFVEVGDVLEKGQQVGILEAMKLMNPVEADGAGQVVRVLAGDGEPVEYGQPLIAYRADPQG
ncbi:acetyl-CoA carboxylase biotin carboxyl carrier protein, partial [Actinomadura fibrosa]